MELHCPKFCDGIPPRKIKLQECLKIAFDNEGPLPDTVWYFCTLCYTPFTDMHLMVRDSKQKKEASNKTVTITDPELIKLLKKIKPKRFA